VLDARLESRSHRVAPDARCVARSGLVAARLSGLAVRCGAVRASRSRRVGSTVWLRALAREAGQAIRAFSLKTTAVFFGAARGGGAGFIIGLPFVPTCQSLRLCWVDSPTQAHPQTLMVRAPNIIPGQYVHELILSALFVFTSTFERSIYSATINQFRSCATV